MNRFFDKQTLDRMVDRSPQTIVPNTTVSDAIAILDRTKVDCLFVVEADRLLGLFSAKDVVRLVVSGTNFSETTVDRVMVQPEITIQLSEPKDISTILSQLQERQICHAPVIDERGCLVGSIETSRLCLLVKQQPERQASEDRLHKLADGIPGTIYIFVIRPDGSMKFEYMSDACREIQEFEPEEVLDNAALLYEQIHPEDVQRVLDANSISAQTLEPFACEWRIITKSGKLKWVRSVARPERRDNGETVWYGTLLDISDRKQIEQQLETTDARLRFLLDNNPAVIYSCQAAGDYAATFISDNIVSMLGYEKREFLENPKFWVSHIHPDDVARVLANVPLLLQEGHHIHEYRFLHKNGSYRWVRDELKLVRDRKGNPLEIVGYWIDISDRKQIEAELREPTLALEYAVEGIARLDAQGRYLSVNLAYASLLGYTPEEMLGMEWQLTVHPDDRSNLIAAYDKMLADGKVEVEVRGLRKDDSIFDKRVTMVSAWDKDHNFNGHYCFAKDISDRKQAEAALRESEERLQSVLDNSTAVIYIKDTQGRYILINRQYERLFHLNRETVKGKTDRDIFPAEIADVFQANDRQVLTAKEPLLSEELAPQDDGLHTYLSSKFPLYNAAGNVYAMCGISTDITDRKRSEEALRHSEATLHSFFDSAPVMMGIVELQENDIVHIADNAVAAKLFGRPSEAMQNRLDSQLGIPKEHIQLWIDRYREAERTTTPIRFEYFHPVASGVRWLSASVSAIGNGSHSRFAYVAEDITERKYIEQALRESEERWQLAIRGNNDGIWDWNVKTNEVFFSPRWKEMLGFADSEIANHIEEWTKRVHPDDLDWVAQAIRDHFDKKTPYYITEHRVQCKDGTYKWILDRGQALWDERGNVLRMVGSHTDVTDRRQIEEALRVSEERFRLLVDRSPVGIFQTDAQGNCLFVNSRWQSMTGLPVEAAMGTGWATALHPEDRDRVFAEWYESAREGREFSMEYRYRTPSGKITWVFGNAIAIRDESGTIRGYLGTVTDISDRKQKETLLENISLGVSAKIGEVFFQSLVKHLTDALGVEYAFVCELIPSRPDSPEIRRVRTVASYGNDCFLDSFEYDLEHTPCDKVLGNRLYVYPANLQQFFPLNTFLKDIGAESYIGVPLFDSTGKALGVISVLSCKQLQDTRLMEETLKIFAIRAGLELERRTAEAELVRQTQRSQLFSEIALKIRQSLQPQDILQTAVGEVQKLLKCDRVLMFRLWGDGSGTVVRESVISGVLSILGQDIHDPCLNKEYLDKYIQGRTSAIADIETANIDPCHVELLKQFYVRANLVVPILQRESCWGLLIAHQCGSPREWSNFEIDLLQQLATQIGIALSQAQLLEGEVRQREELARSNSELQQFAYVASHDLQEPLRMVTSYLQLLEKRYKGKLDGGADEFIAYAVDGANRMKTLIQDLLSYSRVSTRGQPFTSVDCSVVLEQAIANLQISIRETGATITREVLPQIVGDATQLTQLFQNLIGNAIKFRAENVPPQIEIGIAKRTEGQQDAGEERQIMPSLQAHPTSLVPRPAQEWLFWVRDNGIGIEAQYRDRIFVIFQRLHGRGKYPGTGIGLSICKKIVERHGGSIWVESEPGKGTTFYFTIPDTTGNLS